MNEVFYELAMWQEKWCMDNLPPLPITTWISPHYDPYEIDHSHYNEYTYQHNTHNQSIVTNEVEYEHHTEPCYDTESDDDDFYENT